MRNISALMQELGLHMDAANSAIASESLDSVVAATVRQY